MMLEMAANIRRTPEAFCRKGYIQAVFMRIIDDLIPRFVAGTIDIHLQ